MHTVTCAGVSLPIQDFCFILKARFLQVLACVPPNLLFPSAYNPDRELPRLWQATGSGLWTRSLYRSSLLRSYSDEDLLSEGTSQGVWVLATKHPQGCPSLITLSTHRKILGRGQRDKRLGNFREVSLHWGTWLLNIMGMLTHFCNESRYHCDLFICHNTSVTGMKFHSNSSFSTK